MSIQQSYGTSNLQLQVLEINTVHTNEHLPRLMKKKKETEHVK
jgi:hypothetical protein